MIRFKFIRNTAFILCVFCSIGSAIGQDVIEDVPGESGLSQRVWYRNYVSVKLHPKWSVDNSLMLGLRDVSHKFSFVQMGLGVTYRFNRFWSSRLAYESTFFKHSNWWRDNYGLDPGIANSVHFSTVSLNVKRTDDIGKKFRLKQTVEGKFFTPRYQKFQTRLRYGAYFAYRKSDLPWRLRPFVSASVYYYLGGEMLNYGPMEEPIDPEEGDEPIGGEAGEDHEDIEPVEKEASPHGLHRAFLRAGVNFKPIKKKYAPSITLYYAYSREFNLIGNPMNVEVRNELGELEEVQLPFNNYGVIGLQLNWYF